MFVGGCAGSTAGGIKVSRIVLLFKGLSATCAASCTRARCAPSRLDGQRVEEDTISSVSLFFFAYMIILFFSALIVSLDELDFTSAFTASLTCISNVGPASALSARRATSAFSHRSQSSCSRLRCSSGDWRSCLCSCCSCRPCGGKNNLAKAAPTGAAFSPQILVDNCIPFCYAGFRQVYSCIPKGGMSRVLQSDRRGVEADAPSLGAVPADHHAAHRRAFRRDRLGEAHRHHHAPHGWRPRARCATRPAGAPSSSIPPSRRATPPAPRPSFLGKVYGGSLGLMMSAMVEGRALTREDIDELSAILEQAGGNTK